MKVECPCCETKFDPVEAPSKPRSFQQHKRYFKLCKLAFDHWPHGYYFQPVDEIEARKFLQVLAHYGKVKAIFPLSGVRKDIAISIATVAIRAVDATGFPVIRENDLRIVVPDSISYAKLKHLAFCELNDKVEAEIEKLIGVSCEQLLTEKAA